MKRVLLIFLFFIGLKIFAQVDKIKVKNETDATNESSETFTVVDECPEFPGGMSAMPRYIQKNLPLPSLSCQDFCYGIIYLKFVVTEQGDARDVQILRGIKGCSLYDSTLIKIIQQMPKFKPAYLNGKPVKCYFNLPIRVHGGREKLLVFQFIWSVSNP